MTVTRKFNRPYRRGKILVPASVCGLIMLAATACNVDPTDPDNVPPVRLVNDTSARIHVSWCSGDDADCKERRGLGELRPGGRAKYKISDSEIVFRLDMDGGAVRYLCKDEPEGSTMNVSKSVSDLDSAYKNCG
ncbi:hypothetical protein [Streptomyces collinus]|uniref:hypothetical protein n=1 Tax=Streptomyces collinus TaxID=42684 RepID=UPI002942E2C4|nr:hypothetical protein [Streptomyces collinus]